MVLSMERWVGKVAVVTGASSGIGAAIVEQLVENGLHVVALARRKDRLDKQAKKLSKEKGKLYPLKTDITKEEDILNTFKWIKEHLGPVHILINSAGIYKLNNLSSGSTKDWNDIFQVNVFGLCIATREAVKDMKANNVDGHIVHINSIAGHKVYDFPKANVNPAAKFAVTALAETLRLELNSLKLKIKVTSISPGLVDTGIVPTIIKMFVKKSQMIEARHVADAIIYALSTPPHVQIQELTIRPVLDFTVPRWTRLV